SFHERQLVVAANQAQLNQFHLEQEGQQWMLGGDDEVWFGVEGSNDRGVTARVTEGVWKSGGLLLKVSLGNEGAADYHVTQVGTVGHDGTLLDSGVAWFRPRAGNSTQLVGIVPSGGTGEGVLWIRDAARLGGQSVTLILGHEADPGRVSIRLVLPASR
ncbi:MAG: hypothetical protein AAGC55_26575, partial [Myxococcota bacterium]